MKIKTLVVDNNVTKVEHIRGVVEMLRKYVEVGEREQKEFGEVFTKYSTISDMLDLVSVEDWSNPNMKFLDTSAGAGNFPAVIIERLMDGLVEIFPNEEDRYKHIIENMIYMVELQAKNAFLILAALDPLDIYELNILNASFLSEEFDNHMKNVWKVDNFDYVVQNPPYQNMIKEDVNRMDPIYNIFIDKSIEVSDKVISIHPSRWTGNQKRFEKFRQKMFNSKHIVSIKHYDNSQEVFGKGVDIKGGIHYFLYDKSYIGDTKINDTKVNMSKFDILPTNFNSTSIIEKVTNLPSIGEIYNAQFHFEITSNDNRLVDNKINERYVKCYVSQQKGFEKYIDSKTIRKSNILNEYKVITARAAGRGGDGFGNMFIGHPGEVWSQSYISFSVKSEQETESLISYMNTKFCNFMLSLRKNTQDINKSVCKWIPLVPFDREWTDEMLFEYFDLTLEERNLILNSNV